MSTDGVMVTLQDFNQIVGAAARATPSEVVIVYEDFSTGLKAKRLLDQQFAAYDRAGKYHLNLWEFKVLRLLPLRAQAVRDASAAAIVCVATRGDEELPPGVKEWAERWAREKTDNHPTLMLLVDRA